MYVYYAACVANPQARGFYNTVANRIAQLQRLEDASSPGWRITTVITDPHVPIMSNTLLQVEEQIRVSQNAFYVAFG